MEPAAFSPMTKAAVCPEAETAKADERIRQIMLFINPRLADRDFSIWAQRRRPRIPCRLGYVPYVGLDRPKRLRQPSEQSAAMACLQDQSENSMASDK